MQSSRSSQEIIRKTFSKIESVAQMPSLIEVQRESYRKFLQDDIKPESRQKSGLQEVLRSIFPINDPSGISTLDFVKYHLDQPKYDVEECRQRGINFAAPLRLTLRLVIWDLDEDTGSKEIRSIKEQDVYIGDIPLMTENGTFIINGTERVVVSQMHRSPGVFFGHDEGKTHASGKFLYFCRVIPYRGSWLDIEFDAKDLLYFRIDKKRKLYISTLLRALGLNNQDIYNYYFNKLSFIKNKTGWVGEFIPEKFKGIKLPKDLIDANTGEVALESGTKITPRVLKKLEEQNFKNYRIDNDDLEGLYIAEDIMDPDTGEVLFEAGYEISGDTITAINNLKLKEIKVLDIDYLNTAPVIRNTLQLDKNLTQEDALLDIYRVLRPGEPSTLEASQNLFDNLFFNADRYDLSTVGRVKLNAKLDVSIDENIKTLTKDDITGIIKYIVDLKMGRGEIDDIDHLGNRRVRSVGELMENQFRIGLVRMERTILERLTSVDIDTVMPHDLINSKLIGTVVREFFGSSQLSQFMDQTNPLSEITHKRRLSALGPGGLQRDRASFEVRDVHPTHYGRICPIETPEGQNIGLINSMATYAIINELGFIESPYRTVVNNQVTNDVVYLSAIAEGKYTIAQANAKLDDNGCFVDVLVPSRQNGEFIMSPVEKIEFIDVSPMQLVSVAASLIPFLENDDANRALMGSNMQRQAVPLIRTDAPFIGTGIEGIVAKDSGAVVVASRSGQVMQVDGTRIVIRADQDANQDTPGVDIYNLQKYQRSNFNTCITQKPLVRVGDYIKKGEVVADGPSIQNGELALGSNVLVAFMPWNGYNFEDSILISERIVKEDVYTSIHIEEFEVVARDTRLGPEEITRDIPNVSEEALRHLDETGIVHVGAEIKAGDILVGKVTPKSESPMTPEEKLLRAIFGEKAADVRDSSLHVPPGVGGTVVSVRILSRRGIEKDERAMAIEQLEIDRLAKDRDAENSILENYFYSRLKEVLIHQIIISGPKGAKPGLKITQETFEEYSKGQYWQFVVEDANVMNEVENLKTHFNQMTSTIYNRFNNKVEKLQSGDDLPQGALKVVKVFIAMKQKIQPGDKMAGRHGNKGVISRILPAEDMPYMEDGTPVDMVLNPLGVPSRMNVGQILETHLGWASYNLGKQVTEMLEKIEYGDESIDGLRAKVVDIYEDQKAAVEKIKSFDEKNLVKFAHTLKRGVYFATPVFDGAKEKDINRMLEKAGVTTTAQVTLFDGRTGEAFDRKVTVGYIYMLKLHHLVDDKIHARSVGPYSLVTQQPLGGKSHFGGQRFGEMECWALQAYGAAYTLQEMLTVKSDDVTGRIKIYESIIRGDQNFECGIPESFNVMVKELRSLCLNIDLKND
ncbi:DNA-directed RNA polymerase subunit beta [Rickettsiales endosymbiont of Stachyamoeba lipophora]|uniref:DNA-directed RNA polymerase subunit beta n=1 Tax=Rickettsiales endosymbiont of Stachyamoeba lipophora TaxID=2486578 RepID=UPI000F64EDE5|nr:DNA-directed RNA polymerase subunit beta [Rickettsiales endosymbiont of Stachyamoeba lipophora]AZL15946.1 DNA-directed RNA polymerase subunit beta [Rickettsiales endosymbiont of Stachyamoeba lipophora]